MKSEGVLKGEVYSINQNYSLGHDMEVAINFGAVYLDQPGKVRSGGAARAGSYNAAPYNAVDDKTDLPEDFQSKLGQYPLYHVQGHVSIMLNFLGKALKAVSGDRGSLIDTKKIVLSLEKTTYAGPMSEISMRAEDH